MTNSVILRQFLQENPFIIKELGGTLFEKLTKLSALNKQPKLGHFTMTDCVDFLNYTTDNCYLREKSVINDGLAKIFTELSFQESPPELDHAGDIDYIAFVGEKAFGLQIKPVTAKSNFGNYSPSERMRASFEAFTNEFGGKVFIIYSLDGEIANKKVINELNNYGLKIHRFENE